MNPVSKYCDCHPSNDRSSKPMRIQRARPESREQHRLVHEALDKLVAEGRLVRRFKDGRWRYFAREFVDE